MPRFLRRLALAAAVVGLLVLLRVAVFREHRVPVRVLAVERGRVEQTVTNSRAGTVKARRRAKLSPEVGGRVVALPFPEGSRVPAGALLLQLDDSVPRAQLVVAERDLRASSAQREEACLSAEHASRESERVERLERDALVSANQLDQARSDARTAEAACRAAEAGTERAKAAIALARTQLDKLSLRAPFAGVLAQLSIQLGEYTTPSPPGLPIPSVIDLIDTSSNYVSAPMDEVDSARIHAGQAARVTVDSHPGQSQPASVARVAPYVLDVEAQNRTVEVEAELQDAAFARTLLPGTSADVEVILGVHAGVLRLPTTALLEGERVLVFDGERLVERKLETGIRNWDFTEITGGLAEGEQVVVSLDRPEVKAGARARVEASQKP